MTMIDGKYNSDIDKDFEKIYLDIDQLGRINMKIIINCGCEKCCEKTEYGKIAPHRITITRGRDGRYYGRGHAIEGAELIEGAHSWDDIEAMYSGPAWRGELIGF